MSGDDENDCLIQAQGVGETPEQTAPPVREQLFRTVFEHAPIGMILTDHYGIIQEVNETYCHFLGYEAEELIGRVYTDCIHKEDRAGEENLRQRMLSGKRSGYLYEARFTHKDNRIVWGKLDVSLLRQFKQINPARW